MVKPKRQRSPLLPIIAVLVAVVVGLVAWLAEPSVIDGLAKSIPNFAANQLPMTTTRILFTVVCFLVTLILFGLAAALLTPKNGPTVHEADLEKERDELRRRQKLERAQARRPKGSR